MAADPKDRFSDRVVHYARSRPSYPPAFYKFLKSDLGLAPGAVVADVGSGTGISARPLLEDGHIVVGIEPNARMRLAAEQLLSAFPKFASLDAPAESTKLPAQSVDLIL